jgi:hypothetical protein
MALGGIVYIISGHLSELSAKGGFPEGGEKDDSVFGIKTRFAEWINQLPIERARIQSLSLTQKLLHRLRIMLLKADNHLMDLIGKISEKDKALNGNGKEKKDFWQDFSQEKGEAPIPIPENLPEVKIELVKKTDIDKNVEKFFDIQPAKKKISHTKKLPR